MFFNIEEKGDGGIMQGTPYFGHSGGRGRLAKLLTLNCGG